MKLLKLTSLSALLLSLLITTSCEKEAEQKKVNVYSKPDLIMTGAQSRPISASTATGNLSVYYDKRTKQLNYTISWSGLSGAPTSIALYGPAPEGYAALTSAGGLAPAIHTVPQSGFGVSGTYSGSVILDNTVIKEQTLINYLYYFSIKTAAYPAGEIRAQVKFQ